MTRIRDILLTQYIGAIVVALLAVDAIANVIQLCMQVVAYQIMLHYRTGGSVLYPARQQEFQWENLINTAIRAALYVAVSYALVRWLYLRDAAGEEPEPGPEPEGQEQE